MEEYRKQLLKYYNSKYFMSNPDNWQELANQAVARDLAKYQANLEQLYKGKPEGFDDVVVTPKGVSLVKYTPAVESDWDPEHTKLMSSPDKATVHYNDHDAKTLKSAWENGGYYKGKYIHPSPYAKLGDEAALALSLPLIATNPITEAVITAGSPVVRKGLLLAGRYGKQGFNWLSRQADKAYPWLLRNILPTLNKLDPTSKEFAAMGLMGKLGVGALESLGLYEAGKTVKDFILNPLASKIPETALSAMSVLPYAQVLKVPYKIATLPGYMLKLLMPGSKLERALSKAGTIDVNSIIAAFKPGNANAAEIEIVNKVLNNVFSGLHKIDYNAFRKAVQDELITYDRVPSTKYADYGMDRLGYNPDENAFDLATFTFESPRIPYGNAKHYNERTLAHSRTFTLKDDPERLYILESQSDAAQNYGAGTKDVSALEAFQEYVRRYKEGIPLDRSTTPTTLAQVFEGGTFLGISRNQILKNLGIEEDIQTKYLFDNYPQRQLQENLKLAAERGQTKLMNPTPETVAKIEGYTKTIDHAENIRLSNAEHEELSALHDSVFPEWYIELELLADWYLIDLGLINNAPKHIKELVERGKKFRQSSEYKKYIEERNKIYEKYDRKRALLPFKYIDEHETILRKYAAFPKQYQKLYKNADVRTVTDAKGNTWYEVDVPKGYLNSEWLFKQGGKLNYLNLF